MLKLPTHSGFHDLFLKYCFITILKLQPSTIVNEQKCKKKKIDLPQTARVY